jgi:hypothetical protein
MNESSAPDQPALPLSLLITRALDEGSPDY